MYAHPPTLELSPLSRGREAFEALIAGSRRGLAAGMGRTGLWLASLPYGWAMGMRNFLFDHQLKAIYQVDAPVVSVGNLTTGGTGKTPCVEYIARFYRDHDVRVALLSRGYGSQAGRNDEALALEENLPDVPHLQGADRVKLAHAALEELESEVLVLDDGFQHRRLARDLDLVLIDAANPWGHGHLLPRGLLREPRTSLRRADVVIMTRSDLVSGQERKNLREALDRSAPGVPLAEARHQPKELIDADGGVHPISLVGERPIAAFCGIGNPEGFRRSLLNLNANLTAFRTFPDHHPYSRLDIENLRAWAGQLPKDAVVVTTQKDLVKLRLTQLAGRPLLALRIHFEFLSGKEAVDERLLNLLAKKSAVTAD